MPPMHWDEINQSWKLGPAPTTPTTDTTDFLAGLTDKDNTK